MILNKKVLRSFKKKFSFHLVTAFLIGISVMMLVGALTTADTIGYRSEAVFNNLNVEEAEFVPNRKISEEDIKLYEDEYNLVLEAQYATDITDQEDTIRVFADNNYINLTWVFEDSDGIHSEVKVTHPGYKEIYICKKYAEAHSLSIGDVMTIGNTECILAGYALRPDYLNTIKDFTENIADYNHFTTAIVNYETYIDAFGNDAEVVPAYVSVIYYDDSRINAFREELFKDYRPTEYFNADANSRITLIRDEVPLLREEFASYSIILFFMTIVIVTFMMSRIIANEARNIGTLKALGYRQWELSLHYVCYTVLPTLAGGIIGVVGSVPFSKAFSAFFFNDIDSFSYDVEYNAVYFLIAVAIPIVLNTMSSLAVTMLLLRKDAVVLMKKDNSPKKARHIFRNNDKIRFRTLYMIRVLLGNPIRTIVFIAGMTVSCVIILLGGMCQDSQNNVLKKVLPDMMGSTKYETGLKSFHKGEVKNGQTIIDVMFEVPDSSQGFNLIGIDEDNTTLKRNLLSGDDFIYGEYYMTSAAAHCYDIKPGDSFTFVNRITGEENTVTVRDIIDNNGLRLLVTSKENAARMVGVEADEYNNILSEVPVDVPEEDIYKIADYEAYQESFAQILSVTKVVYTILLAVGITVCVLMVNLLSNMIIDENNRNISMLKVLGYRDYEIREIVLRVNHFLLPVCYIISVPITWYMTKLMMDGSIQNNGIWIEVVVKPTTLILYFFIVLAAYLISLFFAKRKLEKVDMTISLKQED